jgi:hypothetical protein
MGGAIGVSALGTALSHRVATNMAAGLQKLGIEPSGEQGTSIPVMSALPAPVRTVVELAFGDATGHIFLLATPFAVLAFIAVLFIREVPLRTTIEREDELAGT